MEKIKMTQEENKNFWDNNAEKAVGHDVSWWDINMKKIEINTISKFLYSDDYVLDVGCSNGSSTKELQELSNASFLGIDYSEKSIMQAKEIESPKMQFLHKSILEYKENNLFDKAISIRCIVNLMEKSDQLLALKNIHAALKPGGIYIMNENFLCGHINLNKLRTLFNLDPLPFPKHNNYIDESEFAQQIKDLFKIKTVIKHASLYYIGTRVFQYLCMDNLPRDTDSELHRFFGKFNYETQNSGDFSPNKVYVLEKI